MRLEADAAAVADRDVFELRADLIVDDHLSELL
jgi:hypothetical protein